jgi:hypothetical protein
MPLGVLKAKERRSARTTACVRRDLTRRLSLYGQLDGDLELRIWRQTQETRSA